MIMQTPKSDKHDVHKLNKEFFRALDECAEALTLDELSRVSGVKLELLRRYLDRKVRLVRSETWDKIYPVLKPYIEGPEPMPEPPPRIGSTYRRHPELVEMLSEQKVLLDEFAVFPESERKKIIRSFADALGGEAPPTEYKSLSAAENRLMGLFLAMDQETRDLQLSCLTERAIKEVRARRENLF